MNKSIIILLFASLVSLSAFAQKEHKTFYDNGKIKEEGQYDKYGKEAGDWKFFYEDGTLSSISKFKKGKAIGEWKFYDVNRTLQTIITIKKRTTIYKVFYPNGKLAKTSILDCRLPNCEWKYFDEQGKLVKTEKH